MVWMGLTNEQFCSQNKEPIMTNLSSDQSFTAKRLIDFAEDNWSQFLEMYKELGIPEDAAENDFESLKNELS